MIRQKLCTILKKISYCSENLYSKNQVYRIIFNYNYKNVHNEKNQKMDSMTFWKWL